MGTAEFFLGAEVCVRVGRTKTPEESSTLEKNRVCYVGVRETFINKVAFEQRMTHMGRLKFIGQKNSVKTLDESLSEIFKVR